jgi:uncharacterized protein (TIGR00251 family)
MVGALWSSVTVPAVAASPVEEHPEGALIRVWVVPRASKSEVKGWHGGRVKVRVAAPPEGGRANQEVAEVLSERLGVTVVLVGGATTRDKAYLARGIDSASALRNLSR